MQTDRKGKSVEREPTSTEPPLESRRGTANLSQERKAGQAMTDWKRKIRITWFDRVVLLAGLLLVGTGAFLLWMSQLMVAPPRARLKDSVRPVIGVTVRELNPAGLEIRRGLWAPIESELAGAETVLVSPDGSLHGLPFAALPGREPGSYLLDDVGLPVVPVPQLLPELLGTGGRSAAPALTDRLKELQEEAKSARVRAGVLVEILGSFLQTTRKGGRTDYESNLRITGAVRGQPKWSDVELSWENLDLKLAGVEKDLSELYDEMDDLPDKKSQDKIGMLGEMSSLKQRVRTLRTQLESVISSPESKAIYWAVLNPQYGLSLHAAPLHVGEILEKTLFSQNDSVVLTSATLTTGGQVKFPDVIQVGVRVASMRRSSLVMEHAAYNKSRGEGAVEHRYMG